MTDLRKAAEMALEALESGWNPDKERAITALRQALAQYEQFQLVCKKCGADRTKDDCKGERIKCGIMGEAQSAHPEQAPDYGIDRGAWSDVPDATKWVDELRGDEDSEQEPVAWMTNSEQDTTAEYMFSHVQTPMHKIPLYEAPPSKPDDLLRQSEQEGWRWAKECEAEVKRLRTLLAEGGQGCSECGVTVSEGYALYCVKCVEPLFAKEWVGLTGKELAQLTIDNAGYPTRLTAAIEKLLKDKNT